MRSFLLWAFIAFLNALGVALNQKHMFYSDRACVVVVACGVFFCYSILRVAVEATSDDSNNHDEKWWG
jgi:hypothetical protein